MRKVFRHVSLLFLGAAIVTGCGLVDEDLTTPGGSGGSDAVPVELSFALKQRTATRASVSTLLELQNAGAFRGMESIRILPFSVRGEIGLEDQAVSYGRLLPSISSSWAQSAYSGAGYHSGLIYNNQAHLYPSDLASMPVGTSSALLYGLGAHTTEAASSAQKHLYGSLIQPDWFATTELPRTADIHFDPDPIHAGPIPEEATDLADLLNGIAPAATFTQTYYYKRNDQWHEGSVSVSWNENLAENVLKAYFEWFTNGGELMAGSGAAVQSLLSGLFSRLRVYYSVDDKPYKHLSGGREYPVYLTANGTQQLTYRMLYDGLRDELLGRFQALADEGKLVLNLQTYSVSLPESVALRAYPMGLGLPAGAAVLRWNGLRFVVVTEGLDGIAAMDRFCYMPPLSYFANTTISTSGDGDIYKKYTEDAMTWDAILSQYRSGKVVRPSTRAVALDEPLQFATGMLVATVQSSASLLPDRSGNKLAVSGTSFPVTGIIIGSQYAQRFNYRPIGTSTEYYLYDNQTSGIYLTSTRSADFRTLALPTPDGEDVYFYLELRNDSGVTFTGAEGLVYPGNYFYLAGKLELNAGGREDPFPAVFVQDHMSSVNCIVSSLENAHVSIPELDNPQLQLGVQTQLNWIMSSGSYVVLD